MKQKDIPAGNRHPSGRGICCYGSDQRIGNKDYAYEVSSYYDRMNKGPAQKSRHLDQVDHVTKNIIHPSSEPSKEKLILDFGYYTNMKLVFLPPILLI